MKHAHQAFRAGDGTECCRRGFQHQLGAWFQLIYSIVSHYHIQDFLGFNRDGLRLRSRDQAITKRHRLRALQLLQEARDLVPLDMVILLPQIEVSCIPVVLFVAAGLLRLDEENLAVQDKHTAVIPEVTMFYGHANTLIQDDLNQQPTRALRGIYGAECGRHTVKMS